MSNSLKKIILSFVFLTFAMASAFGQIGVDPVPPPGSAEVPIDSGVLGLLVAGAVYGAKRIYDQRKSQ